MKVLKKAQFEEFEDPGHEMENINKAWALLLVAMSVYFRSKEVKQRNLHIILKNELEVTKILGLGLES